MDRTLSFRFIRAQRGVTLVELMIALVLGALVVLAATAMVVASRGTYRSQDESTRLAESARFGLELSNRMVRLAGYTNFGDDGYSIPAAYPEATFVAWAVAPDSYSLDGPQVVGSNNSKPGGSAGLNGSDSLTIRYFGTSTPLGVADGNILDCAGFAVPQPSADLVAYSRSRAFNVLFVDNDIDGEPSLRCRRQLYDPTTGTPTGTFDTQTLIRGVESFQVLYGEAIPLPAPSDDLDTFAPQYVVYRTGIGGPNPVVKWENVVSVRIAMLLRSGVATLGDAEPTTKVYNLFGAAYPGSTDPGVNFALTAMSTSDRTRLRRIVQTTVFVRNRIAIWPSLQLQQ